MFLPEGYTESQVLEVIEKIISLIWRNYTFKGYAGSPEDIKQEARLLAIKALHKYNPEKAALDAFIYTVLTTRLKNHKRDKYKRNDPPCMKCYRAYMKGYPPPHPTSKVFCEKFLKWEKRNKDKLNIAATGDTTDTSSILDKFDFQEGVDLKDALEVIDKNLPIELRTDYLRMRDGIRISDKSKNQIETAVVNILKDAIHDRR